VDGQFNSSASWHAFNATMITGIETDGYVGAVYLDPYIYYAPERNGRILRYTTRQPFSSASSWSVFDGQVTFFPYSIDFSGAIATNRYVYFIPSFLGTFWRYDSYSDFTNPSSWSSYKPYAPTVAFQTGCYDGSRYLYSIISFENAIFQVFFFFF